MFNPLGWAAIGKLVVIGGAIGLTLGASARESRADRIVLKGGGQIRGKVVPVAGQADRVEILMERGRTPLTFRKDQIGEVVDEPGPLDEYLDHLARAKPTAGSQHVLAAWCRDAKLFDLADKHDEAALGHDPEFALAREALGHARVGDRWLTPDEVKESQGLVKVRGRWVTAEEQERQQALADERAGQASWARRLKTLRRAIIDGPADRRLEAEQQLREIVDPSAITPLIQTFGADPDAFRSMLARVLGQIPGPRASAALVSRLLGESTPEVREATLNELAGREKLDALPPLTKALRSRDTAVVNRAAWALGRLGAVAAVPKLVPALVHVDQRIVYEPAPAAPSRSFFSTGEYGSVPVLTGPVVGPGVVAFGASSVPYGSGVSIGGPAPGGLVNNRGPIPRVVPFVRRNVEVLAALRTLTGADFGYDTAAWRRWVATSFRPEPEPARRLPQP